MKILFVDDEAAILKALARIAHTGNHHVTTASGPDSALFEMSVSVPDLLITDIEMGATRDGIWLAVEVARLHPEVHIVVMSGNPVELRRAYDLGFPVMSKPFGMDDVLARIRAAENK